MGGWTVGDCEAWKNGMEGMIECSISFVSNKT
jgi:hypothetical protein